MKKENNFENIEQEVRFLRRQNASLRGINAKLKKDIEQYATLNREYDELNEKHIAEITTTKRRLAQRSMEISEKEGIILGLDSQVNTLKETIAERDDRIKELKDNLAEVEAGFEHYLSLPWYKKIFKR